MPVVLRIRGYRFWFYEADMAERPHVHVGKAGKEAKFWVEPVAVARKGTFRATELSEIGRIISEHQAFLLDTWGKESAKHGNG